MLLSDTKIRAAKPHAKAYKLRDGQGLFMIIGPRGQRWWRLRFRIAGTEKMLSLGTYPAVSLREARKRRNELREQIERGIDPSLQRASEQLAGESTFAAIGREWYTKHLHAWTPEHAARIKRRLERDIFPWIGPRPIAELTAPELLMVLRRIESRSVLDTAHRALQNCSAILRYAVATGRAPRDPCADLRGALPPARGKHHAAITDPQAAGALLRAIENYQGSLVTKSALQLAPLLFVRPGELRRAEWSEIDTQAAEWRIPEGKMKARVAHIVPLAKQAIEIIEELRPLTGSGRYLFPSERTGERPMSDGTMIAAIRRMGYAKGEMTAHGFRSLASTLLNEQGWSRDAIERQLAHAERDATRAAYNRAQYLAERRRMMQAWADYLAGLRVGAQVIPLRTSA